MTKNKTKDELKVSPYKTTQEKNSAETEINEYVWRQLQQTKFISKIVKTDDFKFWRKEWSDGITALFADESEEKGDERKPKGRELVRVYTNGTGINVEINKSALDALPDGPAIISSLIEPINRSFSYNYYRALGFFLEPAPLSGRERNPDEKLSKTKKEQVKAETTNSKRKKRVSSKETLID